MGSSKRSAYMARFCRPTTDTPVAKARLRNSDGSITGFFARRSQKKNRTTTIAPAAAITKR